MTDVTVTGGATPEDGEAIPGGPGEDAGLLAERERLARQLRDTRLQLAMTQARLTALQGSTKMRFGTILANAAHRPWPRGVQLPGALYKLWRERGLKPTGAQSAATALASAQLTDLAGTGERFLSALTAPSALQLADPALALAGLSAAGDAGARGIVVTGAISALGAATLAPDAIVQPLLPHDADVVLEGTGADLVLIEAAALLPGQPWAFATDPAAADRGRRLARMIVMARSLGKPIVLVRNVPHSLMPGLSWLAPTVDAVVEGGLGVQLARFNPIGADPARPASPLYAGERDPREAPAIRALLDALTADGEQVVRLAGARSWRSLPDLYRGNAVLVTASASQALEQRASGARVISLAERAGTAAAEVRAEIAAARAAGPLTASEVRDALRDIFLTDAAPARLTEFACAAGLPSGIVGGRQLAVLARAEDADAAGRLAADVMRQRLRPAEVIVATAPAAARLVTEVLSGLADAGIRVATDDSATPSTCGEIARLARLATSPWAAPWLDGGEHEDTCLLDLACARECAQADAVGFGGEYEFTRSLDAAGPALARRELLLADAPPPQTWGDHGIRLFTVARA
ncbi:MAG TPA: hypothetical protein VK817_23620 [Trebonia sp.]|jgi:hypothetical protein|nr:hypothetical protein [Trebonia sp.]